MRASNSRSGWFGLLLAVVAAVVVNRWWTMRAGRTEWLSHYDFIIVGGGTAGSVLANRLSSNPNLTVLLVEAGADDAATGGCFGMNIPFAVPANFFSKFLYWTDLTERQTHAGKCCRQSRIAYPHGKLLGGTSSINMMIYARGSPSDYDTWENLGATGWSWRDVEPYFRKMESVHGIPQSDGMGRGGPQHVTIENPYHTISSYILNASAELGVNINRNYNGKSMLGSGLTQSMVYNGKRWSASSAYIKPVQSRDNLHILTNAEVTKILIKNATAVGVEFIKDDQTYAVLSNQEVILSAGALNSPHILLLSGIGPRKHLEEHRIEVAVDLPGVGQNLQDHAAVSENIFVDDVAGLSLSVSDITPYSLLQYLLYGKGLLAGNPFSALTFLRANSSYWFPSGEVQNPPTSPDVFIMYAVTPLGGLDPGGYMSQVYDFLNLNEDTVEKYYANTMRPYGASLVISVSKPKSRGSISLRSGDPHVRPAIDPNLLSHPYDRAIMRQGLKFAHSLAHTATMASVGAYLLDERYPDRDRVCREFLPYSDDHLDCFMTYISSTAFHPVGTCKMGSDIMAVVDSQLRVHGIDSLRVVDASVMPVITSANTQAPTMMIAEKAAEFILSAVATEV